MGSLENRLLREVAKIWFLLLDNVQNVSKILELQKLSEKSSKKIQTSKKNRFSDWLSEVQKAALNRFHVHAVLKHYETDAQKIEKSFFRRLRDALPSEESTRK